MFWIGDMRGLACSGKKERYLTPCKFVLVVGGA